MSKVFANKLSKYSPVLRILHWCIASLFIGLIWLGWYMSSLSYAHAWYHSAPQLHMSLGVIVFAAAAFKLLWRFVSRPPPDLDSLKIWEVAASRTVHLILFFLMFALPVSGYLVATADGAGLSFFEIFEIPALVEKSGPVKLLAETAHYYLAWGGAGLIALHILAALKHHFIDKDATFRRMM